MVTKARSLLGLYEEMGVNKDKLIFRVPATWAGIQAAAQLEKDGTATQAFHIYRYDCSVQNTKNIPPSWQTAAASVYNAVGHRHAAEVVYCPLCTPCSFIQGVAAAQAGVSVIQPNVGRTRDWYNKHPGIIRDPHVSCPVKTVTRQASYSCTPCRCIKLNVCW